MDVKQTITLNHWVIGMLTVDYGQVLNTDIFGMYKSLYSNLQSCLGDYIGTQITLQAQTPSNFKAVKWIKLTARYMKEVVSF